MHHGTIVPILPDDYRHPPSPMLRADAEPGLAGAVRPARRFNATREPTQRIKRSEHAVSPEVAYRAK